MKQSDPQETQEPQQNPDFVLGAETLNPNANTVEFVPGQSSQYNVNAAEFIPGQQQSAQSQSAADDEPQYRGLRNCFDYNIENSAEMDENIVFD